MWGDQPPITTEMPQSHEVGTTFERIRPVSIAIRVCDVTGGDTRLLRYANFRPAES